jgi:alginate O-acetyltransferase complex protein AlgI
VGVNTAFFWIFTDLLALTPVFWLVRALSPGAGTIRVTLTLIGIYALYLVGPRFVLFYFMFWVLVWALQFAMSRAASLGSMIRARVITTGIIMLALLPMLAWKIAPSGFAHEMNKAFSYALWSIAPAFGPADALFGLIVPLGLSYAVFRALDLLIKVRLELADPVSLGRVLYFGFFPAILPLGPISEYEEVRLEKPQPRLPVPGDVAVGTFRFALGGLKIFLLSFYLERFAAAYWSNGSGTWWQLWLATLAFGLHFYLNFSGYSDLAIGLARLWGIRLKENFNNPYFKTNPQLFWAAWHMSLTRWAQRYVFVPLGGMRKNRQYIAIFATIMVIALWHGLEWPLVVFGLYHASIAVGHRWLEEAQRAKGRTKSTNPAIIGLKMFAVFAYVSLSIPMFYLATDEILRFYRALLPF